MEKARVTAKNAEKTNTKKTERQIQIKQTEGKADRTLTDKQKEQAGAVATLGQRDTAANMPISEFDFEKTSSFYFQIHTLGTFSTNINIFTHSEKLFICLQ